MIARLLRLNKIGLWFDKSIDITPRVVCKDMTGNVPARLWFPQSTHAT